MSLADFVPYGRDGLCTEVRRVAGVLVEPERADDRVARQRTADRCTCWRAAVPLVLAGRLLVIDFAGAGKGGGSGSVRTRGHGRLSCVAACGRYRLDEAGRLRSSVRDAVDLMRRDRLDGAPAGETASHWAS